jgi:tRNA(His) guanylyltransferase
VGVFVFLMSKDVSNLSGLSGLSGPSNDTNNFKVGEETEKVGGVKGVEELGERMKRYESAYGCARVPNDHVMLIRLDGVSFSTWTRGLDAVFDLVFTRSMMLTMNDLLLKFRPQTAYTHSDEISLIFSPTPKKSGGGGDDDDDDDDDDGNGWEPHIYSGRVQKVVSVMASYATARFNFHFSVQMRVHSEGHYLRHVDFYKLNPAIFDARVLSFPRDLQYEVANHMMWRSTFDCHRNCVSTFMRAFVSAKKLHGVDCKTMIQRMRDQHKFNFDNVPIFLKYGIWAKLRPKPTSLAKTVVSDQKTVSNEQIASSDEKPDEKPKDGSVENRCGRVYCSPEWVETLLAKTWLPDKLELVPSVPPLVIPPFHTNQIEFLQSVKPSILHDRNKTLVLTLIHPPHTPPTPPMAPSIVAIVS